MIPPSLAVHVHGIFISRFLDKQAALVLELDEGEEEGVLKDGVTSVEALFSRLRAGAYDTPSKMAKGLAHDGMKREWTQKKPGVIGSYLRQHTGDDIIEEENHDENEDDEDAIERHSKTYSCYYSREGPIGLPKDLGEVGGLCWQRDSTQPKGQEKEDTSSKNSMTETDPSRQTTPTVAPIANPIASFMLIVRPKKELD